MTAEQQEQLWVGLPLLLRTVGEEDPAAIIDRAQELVEREPELLARIVAGCARLELVDRLRVERTIEGQDVYATREWREIDQLTAFLAGTCISIVQSAAPGGSVGARPPDSPGGSRGAPPPDSDVPFQRFVASLPNWAQQWLGRNYMVLPTGAPPEASVEAWLLMESQVQCRFIAAHLAAITGLYPSSVDYAPFDEHDRLHLGAETREAPYEFAWIHRASDTTLMKEVGVGIKSGLAEAEMLRFLLVTTFRQWLGSNDDETLIDRYWTRRHVRVWALRTLKELENNVHHIHAWAGRALYPRPDKADFMPISGLADQAARTLIANGAALSQFGGLASELIDAYLAKLDNINQRVFQLNQRTEEPDFDLRRKASEEENLFSGIVAAPETRALLAQIQQIHHELTRAVAAAL